MKRIEPTNPPAIEALRIWRENQRFQRRSTEERDEKIKAEKLADKKHKSTYRRIEKTRTEKYASDLKITIDAIKVAVDNDRLHYANKLSDAKSKSLFTVKSTLII